MIAKADEINFGNKNNNPTPTVFAGKNVSSENIFDSFFDDAPNIKCSAVGIFDYAAGLVIDLFDGKTKDGEITATKQGDVGDCWLLSGINAINTTEDGKQIIKDSLEYKKDGTLVHLKGVGDYYVSNSELIRAKGTTRYAFGDDDMIIFELAVEKVIDQIADDELAFNDESSITNLSMLNKTSTNWFNSSIDGGKTSSLYYFLTGKVDERDLNNEEMLEKFIENDNKDYALEASSGKKDKNIKDVNGKVVTIVSNHAYSVKSADEETVTIVNPWNSNKEIVLNKDKFLNVFKCLYAVDLSENNPEHNFVIKTQKETIKNEDGTNIEYIRDENGNTLKEFQYYKNGKEKKVTGYFQNGIPDYSISYYKNGEKSSYMKFCKSDDGYMKSSHCTNYSEDGAVTGEDFYEYYKNGNYKRKDSKEYNDKGDMTSKKTYRYDENGKCDYEDETIYENGTARNINYRYYYKNGNLKSSYCENHNEEGIISSIESCRNDEDKNTEYRDKTVYKDGTISSWEREYYYKNGNYKYRENLSYDENGDMKSEERCWYDENGNCTTKEKTIYQNDVMVSLEYSRFDSNGNQKEKTVKKYDEKGNIIEL